MNDIINSDLIRGHIDTIILRALFEGDRYGYDIIKEINERASGDYQLKQPTLYSCLKRLEEQGFTRSYWCDSTAVGGRKKFYSLTDMGRELFIQNQNTWIKSRIIIDKLMSDSLPDYDTGTHRQKIDCQKPEDGEDESLSIPGLDEFVSGEITGGCDTSPAMFEGEITGGDTSPAMLEESFQPTSSPILFNESDIESNIEPNIAAESDFSAMTETQAECEKTQFEQAQVLSEQTQSDLTDLTLTDSTTFTDDLTALPTEDTFNLDFFASKPRDYKSYIEDVASTVYMPRTVPRHEPRHESLFVCDDELPYEEHLKREYGEEPTADVCELEPPAPIRPAATSMPFLDKLLDINNSQSRAEIKLSQKSQAVVEQSKHDTAQKGRLGVEFLSYDTSVGTLGDLHIIERDYQGALTRLIRDQKPRYSDDPFLQNKLERTVGAAKQLGDEVVVRRHNDTIREYNSENYFYSGRLNLWHNFIVFAIMLLQTVVCFAVCEVAVHGSLITNADLWMYIVGVLIALALPAIAFTSSALNYQSRKKNEYDFRSTLVFRLVLCALSWVILFAIAAYRGLFVEGVSGFLATFIYPAILATNLVLSAIIYNTLIKSKKFSC